ncbi:hypothetical protein FS837_005522 [Tulasnella sp. UAMH 9824]|nr:hypothetical protein FS837_005522 [Tulasnella sp. UAMH 9824]
MSGNEGSEDPGDRRQQRAERPKLPSIRSLFGISREDDLDTLLRDTEPSSGRSEERDRRASRSPLEAAAQAQPPVQPLRSPQSPRPPPSSYIAGDIRHSLAGPSDARAGRRSSGSPSDHGGPSRGAVGASTFSDPSPSPLSPPQTPQSPESVRPERRSRVYSPVAGGARPSSRASRPTSRAGRLSIEPHADAHASGSSQHISPISPSATSPSIPRRSSIIDPASRSPYEPFPSTEPSSLRRRHTITDPPAEYGTGARASPSTSSQPPTRTQRRSLQSSLPSLPAPWADAPDRQLPPLPGPSRSESQHRPRSRQSRQSANPYPPSSTVPARPATSPSPYQSHPPSSFPRRFAETSSSDSHAPSYATGSLPGASTSSTSIPLPPRSAHDTLHPSLRRPWTADPAARSARRFDDAPTSQPPPFGSTEPPRQAPAPTSTAGTARYECQYCQKRFNRPSSLKIHVNTHTGEKPFQCPFPGCGRRFSVMSNMRRHSRVHTQARPEDEADPDAEGEPDAASETPTATEHGSGRPSLQPLQASTSSSSGTGPSAASSSSHRASSSTSRRSRPPGTPSRTRPSSTHASGSGVQVSSPTRTPHRAIQPAPASSPSTSLDTTFLMPTVPEPLGLSAQRLYDDSVGRPRSPSPPPPPPLPPTRVTRASLKRQLSDGSSNNDDRLQKRSKPGDKS